MKTRETFLLTIAGAAVAGTPALAAHPSGKNASKPNVVLILVDDMGYKDTGYTGSDFYETPVIDSLAAQSMRFNQGYACAGNSAPSRACLISGQFTPRHGVFAVFNTKRGPKDLMRLEPFPNNGNLDLSCYTIAEAMRDAGYRTGMVGKWHLGDSQHSPDVQGFDFTAVDKTQSAEEFRLSGDPKTMFKEVKAINGFMEESVAAGQPFFAYVSFHAVHTQWQATQKYIDYFEAKPAGKQHDKALYAAMIRDMDDAIDQILTKIRDLGVDDETVIIFTSDNGGVNQTSQAPLRAFKGTLYEGGIRVPFFIHNTKLVVPGETELPVANVDIYPTALAYAGVKPPKDKLLYGISLKDIAAGKSKVKERPALYWHFPGYLDKPCPGGRDKDFRLRPATVLRKGDWKLHLFYEEWLLDGGWDKRATNNSVELYNIADDISEKHNLANEMPQKRDELLKEMLNWIEANEVPLPIEK